jgi:predicted RNA-binding protein with PIN domain
MAEASERDPGRLDLGLGRFGRGVLEAAAVVAGFLALGLSAAQVLAEAPGEAPYAGGVDEAGAVAPRVWLVDGYNVLCTGLLGGRDRRDWWSPERRAELLARLEQFDGPDAEVWVVFDGDRAAEPGPGAGRVHTVFAPSADAWLTQQVRARAAAEPVAVVTADRRVAARARHRGAQVVSPAELLRRCAGQEAVSKPRQG